PNNIALSKTLKEYVGNCCPLLEQEKQFLLKSEIDLVISDIVPIAFEAADLLEIPSIGVSNFTWFTAYKGLVEENELLYLKKTYRKMDYFISLAGSNEPNWGRKETIFYDFYSRIVNDDEVNQIRKMVNPKNDKIIVFIGLGMQVDVDLKH